MKRKAKISGNVREPLQEFAGELDLGERQVLSAMIAQAEAENNPSLRHKVTMRHQWMVFAKSQEWQRLKGLAVWRLSKACFWVDGVTLGQLAPKGGWAIPHHMDEAVAGPRLIWDSAVAAITAEKLWAAGNGTARVNQEFSVGGGWNFRVETVPDYDVRPAEFLELLGKKGFLLVPELEGLLPAGTNLRQAKLAHAKAYFQSWRNSWHARTGGRISAALAAFKADGNAQICLQAELGYVDMPKDSTLKTWLRDGAPTAMSKRGAALNVSQSS